MKKILFIGNTPYQILLSTWIKYHYYLDDKADILIHDRLKGYDRVKANIEKLDVFDSVIVMPNQYKKTKLGKVKRILTEYQFARKTFKNAFYDEMYFANFDFSSQRIYDFLKRKNDKLMLNCFEDGILTYSKKIEYFYRLLRKPDRHYISHENFFCKNVIFGSINQYCMFDPELLEWTPEAKEIVALDKIDRDDTAFVKMANTIFDYDTLEDDYSPQYLFMEESFYQDTGFNEDVELIQQLAERVGKENLMIKIHPRNQTNRFKELGFKTNSNTVIPWEILAMNIDLDNKSIISVSSASLVNPARMFDCKAKTYSLVNCLSSKPSQLSGDYENTINNVFLYYQVNKINNINEVQ